MKIFYQKLWHTKTDWDSPIPQQSTEDWLKFQNAFNEINYLTVPRWVFLTADNAVELHGFADTSSLAYATAIYFTHADGKLVANRTSEIIVLPTKHWKHASSKENPADIAPRGIHLKCLPDCILWWQGPPWLRLETSTWLKTEFSFDEASDGCLSCLPNFGSNFDNGANFVGAGRKLDEIRKLWLSLPIYEAISYYLSKSSIDFGFGEPCEKWQDAQPNLKEDDIVLIKEEGHPGTWPMARVLHVHPGNDGLVRVATVKNQDLVYKRPVHKLCKLPIYPN
ncbi:DUF5641 domain-containing protein [Trichonephila inaurata madagascariensis]|uniref:DUF5641 domain-containing protein n=1 Tax=Trichonephila inaurata madagascariensis TaxID=2747483 RepID=A0A8X6X8U5_9ARAC|nr:DUF5641 domain-containing protein [Trichonephila inaurata madagascariensis]